jgi:hypothetical protein
MKGMYMKKIIITSVVALLTPLVVNAQGTTYLSSLSPISTSSLPVGSDYWLAAGFGTGNNASGYTLNSIQLGMTGASGNPTGFTVMIYASTPLPASGIFPTSSLGTLSGSTNPATAGIYTYTDDSNLTLLPHTAYYIVLTAGTAVANGAYSWSESAYPPNSSVGWGDDNAVLHSSNGISGWTSDPSPYPYSGIAQFAINATAVPEPDVLSLFGLGGLGFLWHRRKAKAV